MSDQVTDWSGSPIKDRLRCFFHEGEWPSLNTLLYGTVKQKIRLKRQWQTDVGWTIRAAQIKPVPGDQRVIIHYEHYRKDGRGDPDNYAAAAAKIVADSLVELGILKGDGFAHVAGFSHRFFLHSKRPGLVVELELKP